MIKTKDELLQRLVAEGGCIVTSNNASVHEIANAQSLGHMYVDGDGLGYILRSKQWLDRVHARDGYMQPPTTDVQRSIQDRTFGVKSASPPNPHPLA